MKPMLIENNLDLKGTVDVKVLDIKKLDTPFHFHKSYELVLVLKSNGYRTCLVTLQERIRRTLNSVEEAR